jgi:hypothetical protein
MLPLEHHAPFHTDNEEKHKVIIQEEFEDTKRGNQNPCIEAAQTTQWTKETE